MASSAPPCTTRSVPPCVVIRSRPSGVNASAVGAPTVATRTSPKPRGSVMAEAGREISAEKAGTSSDQADRSVSLETYEPPGEVSGGNGQAPRRTVGGRGRSSPTVSLFRAPDQPACRACSRHRVRERRPVLVVEGHRFTSCIIGGPESRLMEAAIRLLNEMVTRGLLDSYAIGERWLPLLRGAGRDVRPGRFVLLPPPIRIELSSRSSRRSLLREHGAVKKERTSSFRVFRFRFCRRTTRSSRKPRSRP